VTVLRSGGDSGRVPFYYVAHDPATKSIVVAHEGTNKAKFQSILIDMKLKQTNLNTTLLPQAGKGVKVHHGFQGAFSLTSDLVLAEVRAALVSTGVTKVLVTGHSLGGAIATMDAVMLKQQLGPSISVSATVFAIPRVGNQAWADLVDSTLDSSYMFVTNQNDPVSLVPARNLGYRHPSGEIHIVAVNAEGQATRVVFCPGQENKKCSGRNSVLSAGFRHHLGPWFNGISFGQQSCPRPAKKVLILSLRLAFLLEYSCLI